MWQDLVNVCEAYACYRSDVGYIYGMQLIAALLLLQIPTPADAFILMANCLNRPAPLAFQINDTASTSRTTITPYLPLGSNSRASMSISLDHSNKGVWVSLAKKFSNLCSGPYSPMAWMWTDFVASGIYGFLKETGAWFKLRSPFWDPFNPNYSISEAIFTSSDETRKKC